MRSTAFLEDDLVSSVASPSARRAEIVEAQPLDREAFNAALRALFKAVVIDYQTGELRFQWHGRGESEVRCGWPEDE